MSSKELALVLSNKVNVGDYVSTVDYCGRSVQQYEYSPDGNTYTDQIQFNNIVSIGSLSSTLVSRGMKLRYRVKITCTTATVGTAQVNHTFPSTSYYNSLLLPITATNANPAVPVQTGVNSGFRAFPLQSICSTVQLSLNNANTTWNARETLPGLLRLIDKEQLMGIAGDCPCRPDDKFTLLPDFLSKDQELNLSQNGHLGYTRNSITAVSATIPAPATNAGIYTYEYDICENLIIPGINSLHYNESALGNINNMSLLFNFGGNLADMVCSAPVWNAGSATGIGGAQASFNDTLAFEILTPRLILEYYTVDSNLVSIPRSITYSYEVANLNQQANVITPSLKAQTTALSVSSNTFRFSSLPKRIGFWVSKNINNRTSSDADACLAFQNEQGAVSITLGDRSGLLANCSIGELWKLSREAGSNQSFDSFRNGSSFMWIDPITAFGLSETDVFPGENGSVNFSVSSKYSYQNVNANLMGAIANSTLADTPFVLYLIALYDGTMVINPDQVIYSTGILTSGEIDTLMKSGSSVSKEAIKKEINGAGLYMDKAVFHKGAKKRGGVLTMA
jgi:hypothetical protein